MSVRLRKSTEMEFQTTQTQIEKLQKEFITS